MIELGQKYTHNYSGTLYSVVGIEHMKCGKLYELSFAGGYCFRKPEEIEEGFTLVGEPS